MTVLMTSLPSRASTPTAIDPATAFAPVVVVPTYNNAATLPEVLNRLTAVGLPVFVVNDGSTDGTRDFLIRTYDASRRHQVRVVSHERNQGKAAALRTGFAAARRAGYTHAVTIDSDGQHNPEDIPALLDAAYRQPNALVIGSRVGRAAGAPATRRLGWWMSGLGIWLETGCRVLDSQCGLRVYPLRLFEAVRCRAERFGFEAEIITRAAWAGCPIIEVPVTCHYLEEGRAVSHFRPWRDGVYNFLMHALLTIRQLVPWPHPKMPAGPDAAGRAGAARHAAPPDVGRGSLLRRWWRRLSPAALWVQLRHDRFEHLLVAAALGIGSFMVALPLGRWRIVLAAWAAARLHEHFLPVVLASLLCLTPVGTWMQQAALAIGLAVLHVRLPTPDELSAVATDPWSLLARYPLAWSFGGVTVGFFANWITIPTFVRVFRLIPVRRDAMAPYPT